MDFANEILRKEELARAEAKESITVKKLIDPEVYVRDLLVVDTNELNIPEIRGENKEQELEKVTRDCVQLLINNICSFPKETKDDRIFYKLSGAAFDLPREKPAPVPKPLTKWQKFAKEKGIQKKKKPRSTWDDILQKWVPTYGYRKAAAEKEKNWVIEVPKNVDPNTDMFAERAKIKKENIAKNEFQRLRNIAAAKKIKVPKMGIPPMEGNLHVSQLKVAADVARVSTASVGKFQPKLPEDKHLKASNIGNKKKRKLMSSSEEKQTNLNIAENILRKKPRVDVTKAVNRHIHEEQTQRNAEKSNERKRGKKRKSFTAPKNKGGKKPKSGKHQRAGKNEKSGRKRR